MYNSIPLSARTAFSCNYEKIGKLSQRVLRFDVQDMRRTRMCLDEDISITRA